ncbi:unnamed protein product, partial [Brassica rapa]
LWLSISTHISTLVLGLSTLALPVDCLERRPFPWTVWVILAHVGCLFSTHRTSVGVRQHTQDVCGFRWLSVSTHRTSVAVRHTQDVRGCPSVHISVRWSLDSERRPFPWTVWVILAHVGCLFSTHRTSVGVRQHTQDVCGFRWLSVSTHRTSVAVRVCSCVSVTKHRMSVAVHQYTYQHPAHTSRPWVSVSTHRTFVTSVGVRQHTQDVRGCPCVPCVSTGRLWLFISTHISTLVLGLSTLALPVDSRWSFPWTVWVILAHVGCLFSTHRTSVGVRQHTQDVPGCLW